MSARRTNAASPSASGLWWRSIGVAIEAGRPQRRIEHAADERVVDAELAALLVDALLGRARAAVDLRGVAGVGVHQHELADVVQQARDGQPVAVLVADLGGEPVGGVLGGERVQAEALGRGVPDARALEEVEGAHARGERLHGLRGEQLDGADDGVDACRGRAWARLARRSTAMISATSDSTASTTSAVATWSLAITASRRLRDSASAGKASSASKAIVSRRPWPSSWWRSPGAAGQAAARDAVGRSRRAVSRRSSVFVRSASSPQRLPAFAF